MVSLPQNFHVKIKFKFILEKDICKFSNFFIAAKFGTTFHIAIIFVYSDDASTKIKMFTNEKRKLDR